MYDLQYILAILTFVLAMLTQHYIKFCCFKIDLSLTELYKYWTMNTVSSLSLNRLQSKIAKMTGLVLTDTYSQNTKTARFC